MAELQQEPNVEVFIGGDDTQDEQQNINQEQSVFSIGGVTFSLPANLSDDQRKTAIQNFIKSNDFRPNIDAETGAKIDARGAVGSAPDQDRLATLQQYYPDAFEYSDDNFAFTNPDTGKITLYNPTGFDVGDVASVAKETTVAVGSTLGAVAGGLVGLAGGPVAPATVPSGAVAGAGFGAAASAELFDFAAGIFMPRVDTRSIIDRVQQPVTEFILAAGGQRAGELVETGIKKAFGGGAKKAAALAEKFRNLRIEPPAAAITNSNTVKSLEKMLEGVPFAADVMQKQAERITSEVTRAADDIVKSIAAPLSKQGAGGTIREAAVGALGRFDAKQNAAYKKAFDLIGAETPTALDNIKALRVELESELARAPKSLGPDRKGVLSFLKAIEADAAASEVPDTLPFVAMRQNRTDIGKNLKAPLSTGETGAENELYKRVYAALTLDLEAVAKYSGKEAETALNVANRYTRAFSNTAKKTLEKIIKLDADERAYQFTKQRVQDGGSQLTRMRQQFEPEEWDTISASVLNQMGLARAGAQDATGEVFDVNKFLSEWSKLSPEAKEALFGGKRYAEMRAGLDTLIDVASSLKGVEKFTNTSNSGKNMAAFMTLQGFAGALIGLGTGGPGAAVGGLAVAISPRYAAQLITSPKFIKWLTTPIPNPNSIYAHTGRLTAIAAEEPDLKEPIEKFLQALGSAPQTQGDDN